MIPREKNDLLAHALRYLCESMQVDRAAVFLYDAGRQALVASSASTAEIPRSVSDARMGHGSSLSTPRLTNALTMRTSSAF